MYNELGIRHDEHCGEHCVKRCEHCDEHCVKPCGHCDGYRVESCRCLVFARPAAVSIPAAASAAVDAAGRPECGP